MSYTFNPMTDEELDSINLLPDGKYKFSVYESNKKTSQAGNAMAELILAVWDEFGKIHNIFDYLVFSNVPLNIKKVSHFAKSTGLYEEYKKGSLPEDLTKLEGELELGTQEAKPKKDGGFYPKKNIVIDYLYIDKDISMSNSVDKLSFVSDNIPF